MVATGQPRIWMYGDDLGDVGTVSFRYRASFVLAVDLYLSLL